MQYNISCWLEEQEFEEGVKNLLHHFIIFLLGSKKILEHFDKVGVGDDNCCVIITADSSYQHDCLEYNIILRIAWE